LQLKFTLLPAVAFSAEIVPLPGACKYGHGTSVGSHVGVGALKLPFARHNVDAAPFNV
jgi:hypothetical protein